MARGALFADNKVSDINQAKGPKSDAFINLYLTLKSGRRVQIGFIGLNKSKELDAALMEKLITDEGIEGFKQALSIEYREITPVTKDDLAF